jgi:pilus assembly protein CpaB
MLVRVVLFVLMAAGLAAFAAVGLGGNAAPPAPPPVRQVAVLATAETLRPGRLLRAEDLSPVSLPETEVPPGARIDTPRTRAELFGAMVRRTLLAHQPILPADILRPGDHGFLAAVLAPGMRATSVGVDSVSGTAGLIWPGDHVDLILTQEIADPAVPAARRVSGETVLSDVRVIAIDQQLLQGAEQGTPSPGTPTGGLTAQPDLARTVTLEVTPADAERVAVAVRLGKLGLAVRPADSAPGPLPRSANVTWAADVSPALRQLHPPPRPGRQASAIRVYEGPAEGKDFHF